MKKDQIKSRSEYKIMGFTLNKMLSHAYGLGRLEQAYHPNDAVEGRDGLAYDEIIKEAIYRASKIGNCDVFEIIEK